MGGGSYSTTGGGSQRILSPTDMEPNRTVLAFIDIFIRNLLSLNIKIVEMSKNN